MLPQMDPRCDRRRRLRGRAARPGRGQPARTRCSPRAELRLEVGIAPPELAQEEVAQEVVWSVPLVAVVEWDEEEVRGGDLREELGRSRAAQHGVAHRAREGVEHRRVDEELERRGRHRREELVAQELDDQPVVTRERPRCDIGVAPRAQ